MISQRLGSDFEMINKACYHCGSFEHLQDNCFYYQKPVWNYARRMNHKSFSKSPHPHAKRNMVPSAVQTKFGIVSVTTAKQNVSKPAVVTNTARSVSTANSKRIVNGAKQL